MAFITDRDENDVTHAKELIDKIKSDGWEALSEDEQAEYLAGLRGCYNIIEDVLRVENEVDRIDTELTSLGYLREVNVKTDWQRGDIFDSDNAARYLQNVKKLRGSFAVKPSTPQTPDSFKPYNNANDIEKILCDVDGLINNMQSAFIPCGTRECGQTGGLIC